MSFITKLNYTADHKQMFNDLEYLLSIRTWPSEDFVKKTSGNQLGIKHRQLAEDIWTDGQGSLINRETGEVLGKESDFTEYNPHLPEYTKSILENFNNKTKQHE